MLEVTDVAKRFGGLWALKGANLQVQSGQVMGLIGPNGAGKTTLFNVVTGVYRPDSGQVRMLGRDVTYVDAAQHANLGIGRTFQDNNIFPALTVNDALEAGHVLATVRSPGALLRRKQPINQDRWSSTRILDLVGLSGDAQTVVGTLPYGKKKLLGLGLALTSAPQLLLLDEPAAGLNSSEKLHMEEVIDLLHREHGLTLVVIEHDLHLIMKVCDAVTVLDYGQTIAADTPERIRKDPRVISAYLGS